MLDLFYAFIFVAGAAGLAVIATLGTRTTFTTAGDARRPSASVTGKLVHGRARIATIEASGMRWNTGQLGRVNKLLSTRLTCIRSNGHGQRN
jgi:hypothetical protein